MSLPYRKPAEMPRPEPAPKSPHPRIGNGVGDCPKPGVWSRWWHGVKTHDEWTCDCGQRWALIYSEFGDFWRKVTP